MRALQVVRYGPVGRALELRDDVEKPDKGELKEDEVYVKVCAASINPVDRNIAWGMLMPLGEVNLPFTIGFDISGWVEAVGSGVSEFSVGDEVIARINSLGAFQEYVVAPQRFLAHKPKNVSLVESAGIPLAAQTALQCFEDIDLENKDIKKAFVPAGLGGVGAYATQLLHNVYKVPFSTTVSTGKVDRTRKLLPNAEIIDYKKEDYTTKLADVDLVLDTTNDLKNESKIVANKAIVRSIAATPHSDEIPNDYGQVPWIIKKTLDWKFWWDSRWFAGKDVNYWYFLLNTSGERLKKIVQYIENGQIEVITDSVFEWSHAKEAYIKAASGGLTGKVVVKVAE